MRISFLIVLLAAIITAPAHAQTVFKCKADNGTTIYSQQPCGTDAREVVIKSALTAAPGAATAAGPSQAIIDQGLYADRNSIDRRANACRANAEDSIRRPSNARVAQYRERIGALEEATSRAKKNLAGATRESGLRNEIASLHSAIAQENSSADTLIASALRTCDETQRRDVEAFDLARRAPQPLPSG